MKIRQMEGLLEALEMAQEAIAGELVGKELRLAVALINLRVSMLRSDIFDAKQVAECVR